MRKIIAHASGKFIHLMCPWCGNRDVAHEDNNVGICFIHCKACEKYFYLKKNKQTWEYEWKAIPQHYINLGGTPLLHLPKPQTFCNSRGVGKGLKLT